LTTKVAASGSVLGNPWASAPGM